jgi:hypothetical protein
MIEPILFIHILFLAIAVLGGLGSRTFLTSLVTGLFAGLIHGGMVALVGAQANKFEIGELPYLNLATDYVMTYAGPYLTFANARYVAYLVICGLALLVVTVVAWILRFILCSIVCAVLPKQKAGDPVAVSPTPMTPGPSITPIGTVTPLSPVSDTATVTPLSPPPPAKPET